MKNRAFAALMAAAAPALLAGCATSTPSDEATAAHVEERSGFLSAIDFSAIEVAELFEFRAAQPFAVSAEADASYALPHEEPTLPLRHHAKEDRRAYKRLAASDLPDGWTFTGDGIRHRASGLECPQSIELTEEQRSFPLVGVHQYDNKNLDVSCSYADAAVSVTIYASFWPAMSLEDSVAGAVTAIKARFQVKAMLPVTVAYAKDEKDRPAEEPVAGGFDIGERDGVPYKTSLWLVKTQGWHVKARATYAQQDVTTEIITALMFAISHHNVRAKNIKEPVTAGGEV